MGRDMSKIKEKALKKIKQINPKINNIPDEYFIEDGKKYELKWDYPGQYYEYEVNVKSDDEFVDFIVEKTLRNYRNGKK